MTLSDNGYLGMPGHLMQAHRIATVTSHRQMSLTQKLVNNDLPGIAAFMGCKSAFKVHRVVLTLDTC
jgi:hypothetical protein